MLQLLGFGIANEKKDERGTGIDVGFIYFDI